MTVEDNPATGLHLVARNQSIHIVCKWTNGNPPVTGYLLDINGNHLNKRDNSGIIRHHVFIEQCHEVTTISCHADKSEKNMSSSMMAKCKQTISLSLSIIH